MASNNVIHFLRFGSHNETKVFRGIKNHIKGMTFNANVVAHTPRAIGSFLFINFKNKPYFIDPQTYIFQLDPIKYYSAKTGKDNDLKTCLKISVDKLIEEYKGPTLMVRNKMTALTPSDFPKDITSFTRSVLDFQKSFLTKTFNDIKNKEGYDDYDDVVDGEKASYNPIYLIPPYFYLSDDDDETIYNGWLDLNIKAVQEAKKLEKDIEIVPEIVMDKQFFLNDKFISEIKLKYMSLGVNKILLWIDDFSAIESSEKYLKRYVDFIKSFKDKKIEIIDMYGGYFSLLLSKKNLLAGFCHGPGYGESRGVKPVGGGIPTAKYYLPQVCHRIGFQDALSILRSKKLLNKKKYFNEVCNCKKCNELLDNNNDFEKSFYKYGTYELVQPKNKNSKPKDYPTQETLANNQLHFLLKRFTDIDSATVQSFIEKSSEFLEWNKKQNLISVNYLSVWQELLK